MNPLFAFHYLRLFIATIRFHEDGLMSFMYNFETYCVWPLSGGWNQFARKNSTHLH